MQKTRVIIKRCHQQGMFNEKRSLVWTTTVDRDSGKRQVWMCCDKGHWAGLGNNNHTVSPQGVVSPSVVCDTDGCTFHEMVELQGYDAGQMAKIAPANITVNGRKRTAPRGVLSYGQVVALTDLEPGGAMGESYTITWRTKGGQGSMIFDQDVEVVEGMIINVADTSNA